MQKIYDYISVISQFTKELASSQCFNFIHGKKHPAIQRAVEARTYKHYLLYHIVHQVPIPVQTSQTAWDRGK